MFKFILAPLLIYLFILSLLYFYQQKFIYFPDHFPISPVQAGIPEMQAVTFKTDDGLDLLAWYHPPTDHKLPTIIYFQGNAGNIGHRGIIVRPFLNAGFGILLLGYRGYGGNKGQPSEEGFYKDARAAIQFLLSKKIPEKCLILYGESIGGAVAIKMATEYNVGALILQSPFTSLGDIGQYHYPIFPVKWLLKDQYNSLAIAKQINSPVLILYATNDTIIPQEFSLRLFEAIDSPKQLKEFPDIDHNDLFNPDASINFIKKHINDCLIP